MVVDDVRAGGHWLVFADPGDAYANITGCHCGFAADESDCGFGDSVVDHLIKVALRVAAAVADVAQGVSEVEAQA